ncbi:acyl-CoA thioesterase domain-containing protein [Blastococcus sp. CT_GayMR16]|uniref:acyl-CoA thioesterase n=1 Tax=Blastococcus sp. CT_GayMR16 TaxID=2559607 RepID=UPI001430BB36|nr:acyl-CoA thioesterase domain-containing protein [Blastococcus sp. CT_GayMR16]
MSNRHTFTDLVTLESRGDDVFVPAVYPEWDSAFVFGGQQLAQATSAAMATTDGDRTPHSMHAHFLAVALPSRPLQYRVSRVRDGRSFTLRQVDADQDGRRVFTATVSFHRTGPDTEGVEYQLARPAAPDAEEPAGAWSPYLAESDYFSVFDLRELPPAPEGPDGTREFSRRVWFRAADPLPDDPAVHASAIAYASDLGVTIASSVTAGLYRRANVLTSLDHALWWHRPVRADEWTLLNLESVSNSHQRGTVRGTVHTADGSLAASLGQDTLIR